MSYEDKRVIVAGGGGSGMGAATARLAAELGAEVIVLDLRPAADGVGRFVPVDLSDPAAIDGALAGVAGPVHALFNCQGIAGTAPGTTAAAVLKVNFLSVRHLSDAVIPRMTRGGAVASISSTGGLGWPRKLERIRELIAADSFEAGLQWAETEGADLLEPVFPSSYSFSKQAVIVWTMWRAVSAAPAGVRVNCTSPGSTRTPMAASFPTEGVEFINRPSGRESVPDEQAWALLFLNSDLASYVSGVNLPVDGGHSSARALGLLST